MNIDNNLVKIRQYFGSTVEVGATEFAHFWRSCSDE